MDYIKIFQWVEKVINSCQTQEQLFSAGRLIDLYIKQTNNYEFLQIHNYLNRIFYSKLQTLK